MAAVSAPDPSRRSERARAAILQAARDGLAESGYAKLGVEAIAARAGVGKQTIYRWWPSKGAVVFDALLDGVSDDGEVVLPDTADLPADLRTLLRAIVAELADPATDRFQRTVTAEIQHDPALADELLRRLLRPQLEATAARLRAARDAGQLTTAVAPELAVELLYGPLFHRWLLRTAPLDNAYADALVAALFTGLAP